MKRNRQIFRLLLFLILMLIAIPCLYGQKYIVDWAKSFTGTGWNRVTTITSDTDNNIILVGAFDESCDIGLSHFSSKNFHDQVLVKYDSTGSVLWTKHFSSNLYTETPALLTCENGDIFLAGTFRDSLLLDGALIQSSKISALFIASLDPAGNLKWSKVLATAPGIHTNSICKDGAENLYLSGSFREQTDFETWQLTTKGQSDIFLAKVSPTGNLLWVKQIGGQGNDQPQSVLWYNQNIFLSANYNRDIEVPVFLQSSEYGDGFIMKLSENGQPISTITLAGNKNNLITGMTIDREGNIYTAGNFNKQLEPKQGTFFNTTTVAGFVIKFGNNLDYQWTRIITESEANHLSGVTTDDNNRLFLTGTFRDQFICNTETLENNTGDPYIFLLEYNSEGEEQWVKSFKESSDYIPKSIMADKRNRIYLAGAFAGYGRFDSEEFIAKGRKDGFLINLLDPCTLLKYDLQDEYVLCPGETEVLDAGSGFVSYEWNNGLSENRYLSVTEPGNYMVTIEDGYGCLASDTIYVRQDTTDLILPENVTLCEGAADTLDAGGGFTDYNWQNGLSSNRFLPVSQPGIYTISVTDQYGCPEQGSVEITIDSISIPLPESIVMCETESTTLDPGSGFSLYNWNNGLSDEQLLSVSQPGTYTVEVTNTRGCTETSSVEVIIDSISIPLPESIVMCETESTILDPGSGFSLYNWNNGLSDEQLLSVSQPGTYTIEVTNSRGCTETSSVEVTIDSITIPLPESIVMCETESTTLDPGSGFSSYNWNNGLSDEQLLSVSQPGTYTIEVTNSRGCTETSSVEVTIDSITIPLPESIVMCETESTTLDPGSGFSLYNWNNGLSDEQLLTVNQPGTYTIEVTNSRGCTETSSVEVTIDSITIPLPESIVMCETESTTLDPGSGFSLYNWNNGLSDKQLLSVSQPGTYTIEVTNSRGCTETNSVEVTIDSITIPLPESIVICETESTTLDPGSGFSLYNWNNGLSDEQLLSVSQPGTYTIEVTNSRGCTETSSVEVTIDSITIPLPESIVMCETESTILDPGSGFSSYDWNNGLSDEQLLTVNQPGTYTIEVTNSRGCTETSSVEVTIDSISIPLPESIVMCETESTTLDPGSGFSLYNWNNGLSDEQLLSVSQPGTYTVEVTNTRGCTETSSVEVIIDSISIPLPESIVMCETESTILDPGSGFSSYDWNNGLSDEQLLSVSQQGTYTIEVTNSRGCTETNSVEVTIDSVNLVLPQQVILCSDQQVIMDAGEGYIEYNWNNGLHSDRYLTVFEGGEYSVTVTTKNGCNGNDTTRVVTDTLYLTYQTTNEILPEGNNGTINITVTGNFAPFEYLWNTGETIQDISNLKAGIYIIQITDNAGCLVEEEIILDSETASGILDIFNQPNPFHDITRVIYTLPESAKIDISLYDMSGRKVMILVNRKAREGWHTFTFNRNNLVSGVYYIQIQTNKGLVSRKMIITEQK